MLARVVFGRSHFAVPTKDVNPRYIKWLEQIHRVDGSPQAIPIDLDLL